MNKDEYNYLHGYQDKKDMFNEELSKLSDSILKDLWSDGHSIPEAINESLAESAGYIEILQCCREDECLQVLGALTLKLIDTHLSKLADELAEEQST